MGGDGGHITRIHHPTCRLHQAELGDNSDYLYFLRNTSRTYH